METSSPSLPQHCPQRVEGANNIDTSGRPIAVRRPRPLLAGSVPCFRRESGRRGSRHKASRISAPPRAKRLSALHHRTRLLTVRRPERSDGKQMLSSRACLALFPVVNRLGRAPISRPTSAADSPRRRRCDAMLLALKRVPGGKESSFAASGTGARAPRLARLFEHIATVKNGASACLELSLKGERPAVPSELTTTRRRRSRRPVVRRQVSASGAATALRCGCWGGWAAAQVRHAGTPKDRAR